MRSIANADSGFVQGHWRQAKTAERVVVDLSGKVGLPTHYEVSGAPLRAINTSMKLWRR